MTDFGAPQIILICLFAAGLGVAAAQNGKPKTGHHSFFSSIVAVALNVALLWWGGFFS